MVDALDVASRILATRELDDGLLLHRLSPHLVAEIHTVEEGRAVAISE
jgi:hypothetical protein